MPISRLHTEFTLRGTGVQPRYSAITVACTIEPFEFPSYTVPVNKKFTFRFKKTIVLRLTVLSKNGTTTEKKRNGHAIRKRNGTYKKTERNVLRSVYTVNNTDEV